MSRHWKRRVSILGIYSCLMSLPAQPCDAMGHTHGPIYRTLDAVAGGIEKVIDLASSMGKKSSTSCDDLSCDDGCDAATISALDTTENYGYVETVPLKSHQPPMPPSHPMPPTDAVPMPPSPPVQDEVPSIEAPPIEDTYSAPQALAPIPKPMPLPPTPNKGVDDEWLNSFTPKTVPRKGSQRSAPTEKRPETRSPADTYDSLPNPFEDDPQTGLQPRSANQPVSYWEAW